MDSEFEETEAAGGVIGNFHRRRRIEREVLERPAVGRTMPRRVEDCPPEPGWNDAAVKGGVVDEDS